MNILITGGGGFIGSALAIDLASAGHSVVAIVRTTVGLIRPEAVKDRLVDKVARVEKFAISSLLQKYGIDVVLHCAGSATVSQAQEDPRQDFCSNVCTVSEALDSIREASQRTLFVLVSSASIYGDRGASPLFEASDSQPISVYGYNKSIAELLTQQYAKQFDIKTLIVRPFSVYGEAQRKQVIFDLFAKLSRRPDQLSLLGTGEETRDFLHVEDLVSAVNKLISLEQTGVVNIGTGVSTSIANLAGLIARKVSPATLISFNGAGRSIDPKHLVADISLSKKLGIVPSITLESGLERIHATFAATGIHL